MPFPSSQVIATPTCPSETLPEALESECMDLVAREALLPVDVKAEAKVRACFGPMVSSLAIR